MWDTDVGGYREQSRSSDWGSAFTLLAACSPEDPENDLSGSTTDTSTVGSENTTEETGPTSGDPSTSEATTSDEPTSTSDEPTSTSDEPSTTESDTTGEPSDCEDAELPDSTSDCCCFVKEDYEPAISLCPTQTVCPDLTILCDPADPLCPVSGEESGEGWSITDEAALECILAGLRDGSPGRYAWVIYPNADGWFKQEAELFVRQGSQAFISQRKTEDLNGDQLPVTRNELVPAAAFQACLDATELQDRLACLLQPVAAEVQYCIDGGYYDDL